MPTRSAWRALLLAAALPAACAGPPSPAPITGPTPPAAGPPTLDCRYGEEPDLLLSAEEETVLDLVRARLSTGGTVPRVAASLVIAARELAERASRREADPLARRGIRAALARACAFDAAPAAALLESPSGSGLGGLARAVPRDRATHVGAAVVEREGVSTVVVLASERRLRLSPFPRDVAPGGTVVLSGSLESGLRRPRVFVARPSGRVDEIDPAGMRGFRASVPFRDEGRHVVEVTAEGEGGPEVAALLVVASGAAPVEPPERVPGEAAAGEGADGGERAAEASVVRAIQATRRRHGLEPLRVDPAVAGVARRHSEKMARIGEVAHVVRGSTEVGDRLRRAGIPYRRAYENVARAATALDAHETVEESPAHLANVLRADATTVGVGVALGRLPSGVRSSYVTEIFIAPPDDGSSSPLTPEARVREAIWRERSRLRLPPFTADAALDELARESARGMLARDATDAPDLAPRALALGREVAAVDVFVASAPGDAVRSANLPDRRFARVGVGVVTGESRRFGAGRYFIAVVYTD